MGDQGALTAHELTLHELHAFPRAASAAAECEARRAAPEHHDVVVSHEGSSAPADSATMKVAYQSGQSGSALPMRFSCSP